ncbi:MAG: sugar ABC transporter ATP-binding protein [Herpetosiphonaceae bacterium]|nr:sugar ABC transporter ATP-binding protein [Herpetosiphonaceae bacterium]
MNITFSATHVIKRYGGVVALADGNLSVRSGEVLALMGANGSGKSTLSKIITGVVAPDAGQLLLDGQPIRFSSPQMARAHGIAAVYQELSLIPDLTVAENIWLAHEPTRLGRVDTRAITRRTTALLELFRGTIQPGLQPDTAVGDLPPDERQIVEILKTLAWEPRLIILDEATASLDTQQVNRLCELIADWKARDMAIVMVSHRMEEVFRLADRATVLRSGAYVGDVATAETSEAALVQMMIEGGVSPRQATTPNPGAIAVRAELDNIHTRTLHGVSLTINAGEILGLGGLGGQGQPDVLLALFGAIPYRGTISLDGAPVRFRHPHQAMQRRLAYVPGDRGREGLLANRSILENLQLPSWSRYGWFTRMRQAHADGEAVAKTLRLVRDSLRAPASSLSGGNAQKLVLGKWLLRDPNVLLLNDPTKGIDVGAKGEFYRLLTELRNQGVAIVLYSSDDDELLGLCDRVLVMRDGQISATLQGPTLTRTALVSASMSAAQAEVA